MEELFVSDPRGDGTLIFQKLPSLEVIGDVKIRERPYDITSDEKDIIIGTSYGHIVLLDRLTLRERNKIEVGKGPIGDVSLTPDYLLSLEWKSTSDNIFRAYDRDSLELYKEELVDGFMLQWGNSLILGSGKKFSIYDLKTLERKHEIIPLLDVCIFADTSQYLHAVNLLEGLITHCRSTDLILDKSGRYIMAPVYNPHKIFEKTQNQQSLFEMLIDLSQMLKKRATYAKNSCIENLRKLESGIRESMRDLDFILLLYDENGLKRGSLRSSLPPSRFATLPEGVVLDVCGCSIFKESPSAEGTELRKEDVPLSFLGRVGDHLVFVKQKPGPVEIIVTDERFHIKGELTSLALLYPKDAYKYATLRKDIVIAPTSKETLGLYQIERNGNVEFLGRVKGVPSTFFTVL